MIREANEKDLTAISDIFNEVISTGNIIYQEKLFTSDTIQKWFNNKKKNDYPVFVAVDKNDTVLGFGACDAFRARECYRSTTELAVHVHKDFRGQGIGTKIILKLIEFAKNQKKNIMVACIDSANTGSLILHQRLGFIPVGIMKEVARKNNQWLDLCILQKKL